MVQENLTINMLLVYSSDSGSVFIDQMNVSEKTKEVRKLIGYIRENVNLYPYLSGIENLSISAV